MLNSKSLNSVIQCLERTISSDRKVRMKAELDLDESAQNNMSDFVSNMAMILAEKNNSPVARQAAGLQLKNCLTARDVSLKIKCQQRWLSLPGITRKTILNILLSTLGTEDVNPSCAAQCLAYIGATDAAADSNSLSQLLSELTLLFNIRDNNERRKEATVEAIGFICQEVCPTVLANYSSVILGPILTCVEKKNSGKRIRLTAANALLNSLEFAQFHFEKKGDRNLIMQVTCDLTQSPVIGESVIALQIIVKMIPLYYEYLLNYMDQAIVPITLKATQSPDANVALQGLEFWCSVAEIEHDLASGVYDPAYVVPQSKRHAEKALPKLIPKLMLVLANWQIEKNNLDDVDDWSPFKGTVACLTLLSKCCSNTIDYVLPEVNSRIQDGDWRQRTAVLWAVNAVLEEMASLNNEEKLLMLMPHFWSLAKDKESAKVRYAAVVLMSRVFETCPSMVQDARLRPLINRLLLLTKDNEQRVVSAACDCISTLFKAININCEKTKKISPLDVFSSTSHFYEKVIKKLLERSSKNSNIHVLTAAYHALRNILSICPDDNILETTILALLTQLKQMMILTEASEDHLALICLTISSSLTRQKVDHGNIVQLRHECMSCLMALLQSGMVHEDIFEATGAMISLLGPQLKEHLPILLPYLKSAVMLPDVCNLAITLIGDLFRALEKESVPYLKDFCETIFTTLSNKEVEPKLWTDCIATLNEIAIAVGLRDFQPYVVPAFRHLQHVSGIIEKNHANHEDMQHNILSAFSIIFNYMFDGQESEPQLFEKEGFSSREMLIEECLVWVSKFIAAIIDEETSDSVVISSGAIIGLIIVKLGAASALKHLQENLDCKLLLDDAVHRAESSERLHICNAALYELQDCSLQI